MKFSQSQEPLVSVCIPAYNSEKTIAKTISSLILQTYKNLEIIIIDNCSSDETVKICQDYCDPRIKIIQNDEHLPIAEYNWNRCFQYAKGEFMAIFHADDVYSPLIVEHQINAFIENPMLGGIFTSGNNINENDEIISVFRLPPGIKGGIPYTYKDLLLSILEYRDFLSTPSAMIPTKLYKTLAPFRYDQFGSASDLDMWLRVSQSAPIAILDEKLINYRWSQISGRYNINFLRTNEDDFFRVLDFHIGQGDLSFEIPAKSIEIYEHFRFEDVLLRAKNLLLKDDLSGFRHLVRNFSWTRHISLAIAHPKRSGFICIGFLQLVIGSLIFSLLGVNIMRMFFVRGSGNKPVS